MKSDLLDTPWKIGNAIRSAFVAPIVRLLFLFQGIQWNKGSRFHGIPIIQKHRKSTMKLGKSMNLRSHIRSNPLGPNHPVIFCTWQAGAVLKIGNNFGMTGGSIVTAERIEIGDRVAVGANTIISDTDFHPLGSGDRQTKPSQGKTAPIIIEDDVFIGMNCLILKGVTIGKGSVIGAGSVVTKDVPPHTIVAGNPAKVIREIE